MLLTSLPLDEAVYKSEVLALKCIQSIVSQFPSVFVSYVALVQYPSRETLNCVFSKLPHIYQYIPHRFLP